MARDKKNVSPVQLLRAVREKLEQGWPSGLTVLAGDDLYHLDAAQRALLGRLVPDDASEFALTVYGEQRVDLATVVSAARSVGMFAPRRVVLVREVAALDGDPDPILEYAAGPPSNSYLLIRAPQLDRRRKLHQALLKSGTLLEFVGLDPLHAGSLAGDVAAMAKEKGVTLDRSGSSLLAELCAGDFYRVNNELDKMAAWLHSEKKGRASAAEVRELAAGSGLLSGWEVADAILERDRAAAIAALRRLVAAGDEPLRILGGIAYRARAMLQARAMIEEGTSPGQAVRAARLWGMSPQKIIGGLKRYSLGELTQFPAHLLEADRTLKSRGIAPRAVLEGMLERMMPDRHDVRSARR